MGAIKRAAPYDRGVRGGLDPGLSKTTKLQDQDHLFFQDQDQITFSRPIPLF